MTSLATDSLVGVDPDLAALLAEDHGLQYYADLPNTPGLATMRRAVKSGALAATKVGGELRVRPDDFKAWMISRRKPASAVTVIEPDVREWARKAAEAAPPLPATAIPAMVTALTDALSHGSAAAKAANPDG